MALSDAQTANLRQIVAEINQQTDFTTLLIRGFSDLLDRVLANRAILSHEAKLLRLKYIRVASRLRKIEAQDKIAASLALEAADAEPEEAPLDPPPVQQDTTPEEKPDDG